MKRKLAAILSSVLSVSLLAGSAVWSVGAAEPESTDPTTYIEITHENTTDADIGPMATYWQFVGDQQILFAAGDRLEYDLYVSHKLKGIGGFEMDKDHNAYQEYIRAEQDYKFVGVQDGVQAAPSNAEVTEAGVWEHRVATMPQRWITASEVNGALNIRLIYAIDQVTIPANTTVTVRLANIRVTDKDGNTKATFFDANNQNLLDAPICNTDGLPGTPEVEGIASAFKTVSDTPAMPDDEDAYIEITHTNNAEADKAFASYWTLVSEEYDFLEGDVLEYDVVVSRKIKGIGGMEIQMSDNAWGENMRDCLDLFDNNGIQVHPNKFAVQEANKWQHRTIQIPAKLLDAGNGGAAPMDLMYAVDLTDEMLAPGETITVRLANIRITNGGEVRDTFFDKDNDIDVSDLKVEAGAADPEVATTFKTVGAKAPEDPDEPVIPDVPEDEQLVKIDGVKDSRYSEYNSIDIVDAYADGGVDPEQNFDDVTGKLYYTWDDNYIYSDGRGRHRRGGAAPRDLRLH